MRVLLTGFGPFPGAPVNPSGALAMALARRRRPAFAAIERRVHVFATTYSAIDRELPALLARRPDIVLMFGLAGRTPHLRVETRARNARSVLFPDASRHRATRGVIAPGAPSALKTQAPCARLLGAIRAIALPSRLSRDAGRYLCNYAYWRALDLSRDGAALVQFIHIPAVSLKARPRRRLQRRSPSLRLLLRAAETLLIALMVAGRR